MTILSINWSQVGLQIGYLLFSLSILVILHEFGHFITAKWFKCRVDKFYLFFDPWFSIVKKKIGETVYGIGWLPLGGYVKIAGMVDESMDKEQMKQPPQPWEFRSKPAWQRLIIMLAGVTMNILLAFFIYAMILYKWGDSKIPVNSVKYGLSFNDSLFNELKFRNGDKILAVDDKPVAEFGDIVKKILLSNKTVTIERGSQQVNLNMPPDIIGKLVTKSHKSDEPLISAREPVLVSYVPDSGNAWISGLRKGDRILAVDSIPTNFVDEFKSALNMNRGHTVLLKVQRGIEELGLITPVKNDATIGFGLPSTNEQLDSAGILTFEKRTYSLLASFPAGVKKTGTQLKFYIDQFKKILSPKTGAYKGLTGFKGMASIFPKNGWDWEAFWNITAFFSIVLAFMNLLPIPALDGGHVLFTLIEMISGRKPSDKFLEYAQIAGMILLIGLMLFANGNDWFGWGRSR